ncbi:TlpA disulfide reductase family protein [uncultured Algibacter sp.]|uniref:TlpA family protein disulfide reductase n=1 Tax=uncultured Algibacter sp. TaxID=298659 RepID=UPI00321764F4
MKNLIYLLSITLVLVSCQKEAPKDYVTLSGTITNQNSDSLIVAQRDIIKTIKVKPDGTFSDTLKVESGTYIIFDGTERASVYLKNGYDLNISLDTKQFDETIIFKGLGEDANNYLAKKALLVENTFDLNSLLSLDQTGFDTKVNTVKKDFETLLANTKNLDSTFISNEKKQNQGISEELMAIYKQNQGLLALKGQESPKFMDYENFSGGTTSLNDFKGKYVYIDLWATWCGPCKAEIPFLQKVEKNYHGKNIEFVSISIDRPNAYNAWRTMVKEKQLSGVQLYAKGDQSFTSAYKVTGIPRFILISPEGNIVDADAPRPSDPALINLFNELKV